MLMGLSSQSLLSRIAGRTKRLAFGPDPGGFLSHFLLAMTIGVVAEVISLKVEHTHFGESWQNWGLDTIMALNQEKSLSAPGTRTIWIDVDDATWRSAEWGGGEPGRAPRDKLWALAARAFDLGAAQVVVDVVVEDPRRIDASSPERARNEINRAEDADFAASLRDWASRAHAGQRLILVRTLRSPLRSHDAGVAVDGEDARTFWFTDPYLGEMRSSSAVDRVVEDSRGRIVVAAPYFRISGDGILRRWDLISPTCRRGSNDAGVIEIVPSVQVSALAGPGQPAIVQAPRECAPFPMDAAQALGSRDAIVRSCRLAMTLWGRAEAADAPECRSARKLCEGVATPHANNDACAGLGRANQLAGGHAAHGFDDDSAMGAYWNKLPEEFTRLPNAQALPNQDAIGHRIIFRYAEERIPRVSATKLLAATGPEMTERFDRRIAIIGQSFVEAGDRYDTPLGSMAGAAVLFNSIESLHQYGLLRTLTWPEELLLSTLLVSLVAWACTRFDSVPGVTAVFFLVAAIMFWQSARWLSIGVWLSFVLPVLAVLIERGIHVWLEYFRSRIRGDGSKRH
jgi:hypothetical protein